MRADRCYSRQEAMAYAGWKWTVPFPELLPLSIHHHRSRFRHCAFDGVAVDADGWPTAAAAGRLN